MTSFWPNVTKVPFCVYSAFSSFLYVVRIDVYFCTLSVQGQRGINRSSSGWCIQLDSTSLTASKAISRKSMSFSGSTLSHIEHCKSALTIRIPGCWQQMTWVEKKNSERPERIYRPLPSHLWSWFCVAFLKKFWRLLTLKHWKSKQTLWGGARHFKWDFIKFCRVSFRDNEHQCVIRIVTENN